VGRFWDTVYRTLNGACFWKMNTRHEVSCTKSQYHNVCNDSVHQSLYCYSSSECCVWFDVRGSIPLPRFAFRPTVCTNAASTGCQFGSESLSWPLPLCGNASTGLPSWKAIEVVHGYCLHRLDASSYQEYRRQLDSRVLFSAGPRHGNGPSRQRSVISRMRSLYSLCWTQRSHQRCSTQCLYCQML